MPPPCEVCSAPSESGPGVQLCSACAMALDRAYEQLRDAAFVTWMGSAAGRAALDLDKSRPAIIRVMRYARDRAAVVAGR